MYITVEDLVTKFGAQWDTPENLDSHADLVNAWLFGKSIPLADQVSPQEWIYIQKAAFFLARAAKENELYTDSSDIKSEKVSADTGTSVETSYFAYVNAKSRWIKSAEDLLSPWLNTSRVFQILKIN